MLLHNQKSIAAMQPYFLPYIGYFQLINKVDIFIVYNLVNYRKKSWINKNRIKDKGSSLPVNIIVPVQNQTSFKLISDIKMSSNMEWKNKIENLLFFNYKKSEFFKEVFPLLQNILKYETDEIHNYNSNAIKRICSALEISTKIVSNNDSFIEIEKTLSKIKIQNGTEIKEQRVFELCKYYNAKTYLNPINGMELYDFKRFKNQGFNLKFIQSKRVEYPQFNMPFEPNLSIVDVLFHNGFKGTKALLSEHSIITK